MSTRTSSTSSRSSSPTARRATSSSDDTDADDATGGVLNWTAAAASLSSAERRTALRHACHVLAGWGRELRRCTDADPDAAAPVVRCPGVVLVRSAHALDKVQTLVDRNRGLAAHRLLDLHMTSCSLALIVAAARLYDVPVLPNGTDAIPDTAQAVRTDWLRSHLASIEAHVGHHPTFFETLREAVLDVHGRSASEAPTAQVRGVASAGYISEVLHTLHPDPSDAPAERSALLHAVRALVTHGAAR